MPWTWLCTDATIKRRTGSRERKKKTLSQTMKMYFAPSFWALLIASLASRTGVLASPGDSAQVFQGCVHICQSHICDGSTPHVLPLSLQIMQWTCTDDCRYQCMHMITDEAKASGMPVLQYYGKWPFWRFAGLQEPASVLFSLLNLLAHMNGFIRVRKKVSPGHPMRGYYLKFALVSINAWLWSTVFHSRGEILVSLIWARFETSDTYWSHSFN